MRSALAVVVVLATVTTLTACAPAAPRECTGDEVAAIFGGIFAASDVTSLGEFELPSVLADATCAGQYDLPLVQSEGVVFGGGTYSVAVVGGGDAFYDKLGSQLTDDGFTALADEGAFSRWDKGQLEVTALELSNALTQGAPESLSETVGLHVIVITTLTSGN